MTHVSGFSAHESIMEELHTSLGHKSAAAYARGDLTLAEIGAQLGASDSEGYDSRSDYESDQDVDPDEEYLDGEQQANGRAAGKSGVSANEFLRRRLAWERGAEKRKAEAHWRNIAGSTAQLREFGEFVRIYEVPHTDPTVTDWANRYLAGWATFCVGFPHEASSLIRRNFGGMSNRPAFFAALGAPNEVQIVRAMRKLHSTIDVMECGAHVRDMARREIDIHPLFKSNGGVSMAPRATAADVSTAAVVREAKEVKQLRKLFARSAIRTDKAIKGRPRKGVSA